MSFYFSNFEKYIHKMLMTKENLDNIIKLLEDKNVNFKLDTHINFGKSFVRGIFIYDGNESKIKEALGSENLKGIKFKKSFLWYLGEKKKAILLKPKKELVLEIPEVEKYGLSSIA